MFPSLILCVLALSIAYGSGDGRPLVRASVKPAESTVGGLIEYRISIAGRGLAPDSITVLLPEKRELYPEPKAGAPAGAAGKGEGDESPSDAVPLYVIHRATRDDRSTPDMLDIRVVLEMSYYRTGSHSLPLIEIKDATGAAVGYDLPGVEIKALNTQGAMEEIEPPLDLGGNYTRLILLVAGVIAATLAAVFLYRFIRKKRAEKLAAPEPVPPLEIFLRELAKLDCASLIDSGKIEEYVFGISMVFRKYLSSLYGIDAMEMTSDEIDGLLKKVMGRDLHVRYGDAIMQSFNLWDLSKYAEFEPSREILMANLEKTEKIARALNEEKHGNPA
jgi:hypothetical protein